VARVLVKNLEPMWVQYDYEVTVPDELSDDEAREYALERIYGDEKGVEVTSGPEVKDTIHGMDNTFEATEVLRG
jgi:hypothetical protein